MAIGDQIKRRREELGLTQEELAKRLGYKSKSTINKIELGINDIPQKKIVAFADALETSVADLMEWGAKKSEPKKKKSIVFDASPSLQALSMISEKAVKESFHRVFDPLFSKAVFASEDEKELLQLYSKLNEDGKDKLFDYLLDLLDMPKYVLTDEEISKQLEEYRNQLETEMNSDGKLSASLEQKEA